MSAFDVPAPSTRTDRRVERTRAALVTAARELITEKGVAGLRISELTARVDVAAGSFYTHFETKEDVVEAVVAAAVSGIADAVLDQGETFQDPAQEMSVAIRSIVRLAYDDRELASLVVNLRHAEASFEAMIVGQAARVVQRGVDDGRFTVRDLQTVLSLYIGGCLSVMRRILGGDLPDDADVTCAATLLHSVGLDREEALEIAARPMPQIRPRR